MAFTLHTIAVKTKKGSTLNWQVRDLTELFPDIHENAVNAYFQYFPTF